MDGKIFFVLFLLSGICSLSFSQEYPTDFKFIEVPDLHSGTNQTYPLIARAVPVVGESFFDNRCGTLLIRATEMNYIHGRHEYARFDPFNADKSMIILDPEALWNVYSTASFPYNSSGNLVMTINLEEPRWDPNNPNLIWGLEEFSIKTVNVSTGQVTTVKDFSSDPTIGPLIQWISVYRITTRDEGESSVDKRYWAFFLQGDERVDYVARRIFTWDAVEDRVLGMYEIAQNEVNVDWVGMSPLGNWVVIGGDAGNGGNLDGVVLANRELTQFRSFGAIGHSDVGLDSDGNEVLVGQNAATDYIDLMPLDMTTPVIPLVRLFYNNESPQGMQSGVHISCNCPGYCVISTFIEPNLPEQNWLDRSNILVHLNRQNPRGFYLSKIYGTTGSYWEETHTSISNDGSRVVWATNWNQNIGQEQVFMMQLNMPPNWTKLISGVDADKTQKSDGFDILQNYPNPFNSTTTITYELLKTGTVELSIYNLLGKRIRRLIVRDQPPGVYKTSWDARDDLGREVTTGVYMVVLLTETLKRTRKVLYLK